MNGSGIEIDADSVRNLRSQFTPFVNRLLEAERSHQGLPIESLEVTLNENTPDGGVDAIFRDARESESVPGGTSAWQFKRSGLTATECKAEYNGAGFAQEIVAEGGAYCLALGADYNSQQLEERRQAIVELVGDPRRVKVYNAGMLAAWANRYPAVLRFSGRPFGAFVTLDSWSARDVHTPLWVPDSERTRATATLRSALANPAITTIRLEGPAGFGKSRLVLESLRVDAFAPRVLYADQEADIDPALVHSLIEADTSAILVIDECDRRRDRAFRERLHRNGSLKLITIGHPEEISPFDDGLMILGRLNRAEMLRILANEFTGLDESLRALIGDTSEGDVRSALEVARRIVSQPGVDAYALVSESGHAALAREVLEEGPFGALRAIALLRRVGWDDELAADKSALASWAGIDQAVLDAAEEPLAANGFLERQGRYRYATPHTVALALAAHVWQERAPDIVGTLLPALSAEGAESLLARAADLGRYPSAQEALAVVLGPDGPVASIELVEQNQTGRFLTYLAMVDPVATASHLSRLISSAAAQTLEGSTRSRRDLVSTLEKLAWHEETFVQAADSLLTLSLHENETWSNNATGTWLSLFGARLPSTAADPVTRLEYLAERAANPNPVIRKLVANAASKGIHFYESRAVSAELQGGSVVAGTGSTRTGAEDRTYREEMIVILADLASDADRTVSDHASDLYIQLGGQLDDTPLWAAYVEGVERLSEQQRVTLRREAQRWRRLAAESETRGSEERLDALIRSLSSGDPVEQLADIGTTPMWTRDRESVVDRASGLLTEIVDAARIDEVWEWLGDEAVEAAYLIGRALGRSTPAYLAEAVSVADQNPQLIAGYVDELVDHERLDRDEFLDSELGQSLPAEWLARISMSLSPTDRSLDRVAMLIEHGALPPTFARSLALGRWIDNYSDGRFSRVLDTWVSGSGTASDLAAVTDLLALRLHGQGSVPEALVLVAWRVLEGRLEHPNLGNAEWDWAQIACQISATDPARVASLVFDLIDRDVILISGSEEADVLRRCAEADPEAIWKLLVDRSDGGQNFRIMMTVRGWLLKHFPVETIISWTGDSADRAELVAEIAHIGDSDPGPLARWLLVNHGHSERVRRSLFARFMEGMWTGERSARIAGHISDLESWTGEPAEVRAWADELIGFLREDMRRALRDEEEGRF